MCLCKRSSVIMGMSVCVLSSTKSPVNRYLCLCVCMCVWVCNGSAPRSAKRGAQRDVCVVCSAHVSSKVGMSVCMCACLSSSLYRRQLLVCLCVYICMHMYANTAKRLRVYKAVILQLNMQYFALKIVSYSYATTKCNLLTSPHKENHLQDTLTNCVLSSKGWCLI